MKIEHPQPRHIPLLRQLWQMVFGDTDAFLDRFFSLAYSPERCLCALEKESPAGMLYWLPCGKYAYIYAVATHPDHRGKGICRALMDAAHEAIAAQGYEGTLLYPQEEGLRNMYRKMGYIQETHIREHRCSAGDTAATLVRISPEDYFALRSSLLPPGAVKLGAPFSQIAGEMRFYRGKNLLLAVDSRSDGFFAQEYLGAPEELPGIVNAFGEKSGTFRCPGQETPFAMFHPLLEGTSSPCYFAFPLD